MMKYIFIHGLGQSPNAWSGVIKALPENNDIFVPSLTNLSDDQKWDYKSLYNSFENACRKHIATQADLCGLSLGAVLALNYAAENPENVHSLVLAAPQYKMPKTLLSLQNLIFHFMPDKAFKETGLSKKAMISLTHSMKCLDFTRCLRNIKCPVLIICGSKDKANLKSASLLSELLPNASLATIKDAGHEVNLESPADFAHLVSAFYKRISRQP